MFRVDWNRLRWSILCYSVCRPCICVAPCLCQSPSDQRTLDTPVQICSLESEDDSDRKRRSILLILLRLYRVLTKFGIVCRVHLMVEIWLRKAAYDCKNCQDHLRSRIALGHSIIQWLGILKEASIPRHLQSSSGKRVSFPKAQLLLGVDLLVIGPLAVCGKGPFTQNCSPLVGV